MRKTILLCALSVMSHVTGAQPETFERDPGWTGFQNRQLPPNLPPTRHDFGYSSTNHAGGAASGEIGGRIERSSILARYSMPLDAPLSLDATIEFSGRFAVTHEEGATGMNLGFFNQNSRGWRTPNSLCLRLDGNGDKFWVFIDAGTRNRKTVGMGAFEGIAYQTTPTKPFPADGKPHEFSFKYDPSANNGQGAIHFKIDERAYELPFPPEIRQDGAEFDRFGIWNVENSGKGMDVWFDDVVVNGRKLSFDSDPQWVGEKNRITEKQPYVRPFNDFGWQAEYAHGDTGYKSQGGELGGTIWRDEKPAFYGKPIKPVTLDEAFAASGTLAMHFSGADSGFYFGWFNAETKRRNSTYEHVARQKNYIALLLEGPSRVGHYLRPGFSTVSGMGENANSGPVLKPNSQIHHWSLAYDPAGADGNGLITATVDGATQTMQLTPEQRRDGAQFDHFGFFNHQSGGWHVVFSVDNLALAPAE